MRISDWSSDVCSSDLAGERLHVTLVVEDKGVAVARRHRHPRPEQEGTRSGIRACPQAKPQVAHAGGHAGFDRAARAEHVVAAAVPATGPPEDNALPESKRRRAGEAARTPRPPPGPTTSHCDTGQRDE